MLLLIELQVILIYQIPQLYLLQIKYGVQMYGLKPRKQPIDNLFLNERQVILSGVSIYDRQEPDEYDEKCGQVQVLVYGNETPLHHIMIIAGIWLLLYSTMHSL